MKIDIAYFTSTGNTLWLARALSRSLEREGHQVRTFDPVSQQGGFAADAELLGIVYPVWGSSLPDPLQALVATLRPGSGKSMFLLGNCGVFTGDTGMHWKRRIERKGYDVFYVDHVLLPINVNVPGFNFWPVPDAEETRAMLARAEDRLQDISGALLRHERRADGTDWVSRLGGGGQRALYWTAGFWKRLYTVAEDRCTHCGLCVRMCPTGNIQADASGRIRFGSACILCLKCYNLCPQDAVLIGQGSRDTGRYRRYKGPSPEIKPVTYR